MCAVVGDSELKNGIRLHEHSEFWSKKVEPKFRDINLSRPRSLQVLSPLKGCNLDAVRCQLHFQMLYALC
jgi:hypothetical protein